MANTIEELMIKHGIDVKAGIWNHAQSGKKIVLHKALEQLATALGIFFEPPQFISVDQANGMIAMTVTGRTPNVTDAEGKITERGRMEWSIGEATPQNNKNPYPFAMAEKRAKDRVILKLLGVHGEVYSDVEADDFKRTNTTYKAAAKPATKAADTGAGMDWF